jgi:hypothetical protein
MENGPFIVEDHSMMIYLSNMLIFPISGRSDSHQMSRKTHWSHRKTRHGWRPRFDDESNGWHDGYARSLAFFVVLGDLTTSET